MLMLMLLMTCKSSREKREFCPPDGSELTDERHLCPQLLSPSMPPPPPTSTPAQSTGKHNLGAGLNFKSPSIDPHPSGPPKHGQFGQAERGVSVASTFLSGVLA